MLIYRRTNLFLLQDSEARLDLLRGRASGSKQVKNKEGEELEPQPMAALTTISTSSGHINLFADFEQVCHYRTHS